MLQLNIDIIINILYNCQVETVYNMSLCSKYIYDICNNNKDNILRNILIINGYKFGITKLLKDKESLKQFYKVDYLLSKTNENVVISYELKYYNITKFLLENIPIRHYVDIYKITMSDMKIAILLSSRRCNYKVLIEVIRFSLLDELLLDSDLEELKYLSEYPFELNLNWKEILKFSLLNTKRNFTLYNVDSIGYVISMMTKRWDFLLTDLDLQGKIWELLYFNCGNIKN